MISQLQSFKYSFYGSHYTDVISCKMLQRIGSGFEISQENADSISIFTLRHFIILSVVDGLS